MSSNLNKNSNIITDLVYFLHKALLKQSVIKVVIVKVKLNNQSKGLVVLVEIILNLN